MLYGRARFQNAPPAHAARDCVHRADFLCARAMNPAGAAQIVSTGIAATPG